MNFIPMSVILVEYLIQLDPPLQDYTSLGSSKVRRGGNVSGRHTLACKGAQKNGCASSLMLRMLLAQGSAGGRTKWCDAPRYSQVAQNASTAAHAESTVPMVD